MTKWQFPTDLTKAQWRILEPLLRNGCPCKGGFQAACNQVNSGQFKNMSIWILFS